MNLPQLVPQLVPRLVIGGLLAAGAALALSRRHDAPPNGWREFASETGGFAVELPDAPRIQTSTNGAGLPMEVGVLELDQGAFLASFGELTPEAASQEREALLASVRDGVLRGTGGRFLLMESHAEPVAGHEGLAFTARGPVDGISSLLRARVVVVDDRLYQVLYTGVDGGTPVEDVERFLGSLRLTR